mmetsp:Transcript_13381/g.25799  ORF Transcript_13381/g.25799 Transcript_13381/m.25799 type:complete len:274 (-) Transcript_13381:204-1025(-)|eukprot:CAMPEP_0171488898 /NCGR_PEP_ID=MMETSP0958-20121227/2457_1 /TAXON_ID=87120 /ORGANISM="Aurantiochytrium limacinum, Strain ATCCMYA-1381" /LENGTH=273 /DNA_ID=CAMNT_0012022051 /DNA_START=83 /DNA_END=904 /DNA_ORIENTATION=+
MKAAVWLTTSSARGAYESVAKNVQGAIDGVQASASGPPAPVAQPESRCGCLNRMYYLVADSVGLSSPEEKRKRDFERVYLDMLSEGCYATLVDFDEPEKVSLMGSVSRSVTNFLGTNRASTGASAASSGAHPASGSEILLRLATEKDVVSLEWQTLQRQQNKPLHEGNLALRVVQVIDCAGTAELRFLDHHGKILLSIQLKSAMERDTWHLGIKEAQAVLAPRLEEESSRSRSMFDRQQRYLELEQRKRDRERKKQDLGSVGMQFTAEAMAKR